MNISQRLRTCAKHTGLDAVIELLQEAADEIDALQARTQVQGDPSWWMRETDEGAEWTDTAPLVLSGWTPLYTTPQPAQATQAEAQQPDNTACKSVQKRLEAQQPSSKEHLFELWWEAHMPNATQEQAWTAFTAAVASNGVGIAAQQPATGEPVKSFAELRERHRAGIDAERAKLDPAPSVPATPKPVGVTYQAEIEYADSTGGNGSFWRAPPDLDDEAVPLYTHPAPSVRADVVRVPLQVLKDASEALGNFVSDHGWGDADMQAMDNLDAYIARHEANRAAMLAAK